MSFSRVVKTLRPDTRRPNIQEAVEINGVKFRTIAVRTFIGDAYRCFDFEEVVSLVAHSSYP